MILIADKVKQNISDLECENIRLKKKLGASEKYNADIPELRKKVKYMESQIITYRAKLADTTDREELTLTEKALKDTRKKLESTKMDLERAKTMLQDADLMLDKIFLDLDTPKLKFVDKEQLSNIKMIDKIANLEKLILDLKFKVSRVNYLEEAVHKVEKENKMLKNYEDTIITSEIKVKKMLEHKEREVEEMPMLRDRIKDLEIKNDKLKDLLIHQSSNFDVVKDDADMVPVLEKKIFI